MNGIRSPNLSNQSSLEIETSFHWRARRTVIDPMTGRAPRTVLGLPEKTAGTVSALVAFPGTAGNLPPFELRGEGRVVDLRYPR